MIVSDSHRFICFQPWKVASSTLSMRLENYDSGRYPANSHFNKHLGKEIHKHIALDDFVCLPESQKNYFRFTFVRNPYDRIYSGFIQRYWHLTNDPNYFQQEPKYALELERIERGLEAYIEFCTDHYEREGVVTGRFLHEYVYHKGELMVDFIGCMETFEASFAQVCAVIGLGEAPEGSANVRNTSGSRLDAKSCADARYRYIHEFNPRSIRAVNELYLKDFESLGYRILDPNNFADVGTGMADISPIVEESLIVKHGSAEIFKWGEPLTR